jgi:hypothetical protein
MFKELQLIDEIVISGMRRGRAGIMSILSEIRVTRQDSSLWESEW